VGEQRLNTIAVVGERINPLYLVLRNRNSAGVWDDFQLRMARPLRNPASTHPFITGMS
jgi:hypothetical protein